VVPASDLAAAPAALRSTSWAIEPSALRVSAVKRINLLALPGSFITSSLAPLAPRSVGLEAVVLIYSKLAA